MSIEEQAPLLFSNHHTCALMSNISYTLQVGILTCRSRLRPAVDSVCACSLVASLCHQFWEQEVMTYLPWVRMTIKMIISISSVQQQSGDPVCFYLQVFVTHDGRLVIIAHHDDCFYVCCPFFRSIAHLIFDRDCFSPGTFFHTASSIIDRTCSLLLLQSLRLSRSHLSCSPDAHSPLCSCSSFSVAQKAFLRCFSSPAICHGSTREGCSAWRWRGFSCKLSITCSRYPFCRGNLLVLSCCLFNVYCCCCCAWWSRGQGGRKAGLCWIRQTLIAMLASVGYFKICLPCLCGSSVRL